MIVSARSETDTIKITCPNCKMSARHSISYLEDAIHDDLDIACVACGKPFGVVTVSRTRDAQLRIGADDAGQDGLSGEEAKPMAYCDYCQQYHELR